MQLLYLQIRKILGLVFWLCLYHDDKKLNSLFIQTIAEKETDYTDSLSSSVTFGASKLAAGC